jgi:hypothetical protein
MSPIRHGIRANRRSWIDFMAMGAGGAKSEPTRLFGGEVLKWIAPQASGGGGEITPVSPAGYRRAKVNNPGLTA